MRINRFFAPLALLCAPQMVSATPVLVMPVEFQVLEMSAGGVIDIKGDETESTQGILDAALPQRVESDRRFATIAMPDLTPAEESTLREHVALFRLVSEEATLVLRDPGWKAKKSHFDYTIGPGLAFLADRSGAEKAVFASGFVAEATGGRVVLGLLAAGIAGVAIPLGGANFSVAVVDLKTGSIEWMDATQRLSGHGSQSPKQAETAVNLVDYMLDRYPDKGFHAAR